jgi:hypothetical protein
LGDPTGSNATPGLALRVTGTHKPLYYGKVEIAIKGDVMYSSINIPMFQNNVLSPPSGFFYPTDVGQMFL